jgi:hypothetical protein
LYTHVQLKHSVATSSLVAVLQKTPSLAPQVRTICWQGLTDFYISDSDSDSDDDLAPGNNLVETDSMLTLLSHTTGLVRLCGWDYRFPSAEPTISWAAFEAMARASGSTLQEFSKPVATEYNVSPRIFNYLTGLRSLDWKCSAHFNCSPADTSSDALSNLETLRIWILLPSFLAVLSLMKCDHPRSAPIIVLNSLRLPSLRYLTLSKRAKYSEAFFQTHGAELTELRIPYTLMEELELNIFEACPSLRSLIILKKAVRPNLFLKKNPYLTLSSRTLRPT